jgi:hypothetical protein
MPTIHGRPKRSPMMRESPPAVTIACSMSALAQKLRAVLDGVALGDAAEIDADALLREAHGVRGEVYGDVAVVDGLHGALARRVVGLHVLAIVVEIADAGVGDVEGAVRGLGELERARDERSQLGAHLHGPLGGVRVDARYLAVVLERAHLGVDAAHVVHDDADGETALRGVLVPELHAHGGAHDGLLVERTTRHGRAPAGRGSSRRSGRPRRLSERASGRASRRPVASC